MRAAGSASPAKARTKKGRPAARHASMRRRGRSPEPARMPSLPAIPIGLAEAAAGIGADEGHDVLNRLRVGKARGNLVDPDAERAVLGEEKLKGAAQGLDFLAREAAALHPDDVEAGKPRAIPHHRTVGNDVAFDARHTADHRMLADADELMDCREPAQNGMVADDDMAAERGVVGHDDVIAHGAVMGDMDSDHEETAIADARHHSAAFGAGIHGHVLANGVVATDDEPRRLARIFEVLRRMPDRRERKNPGSGADRSAPGDDDMRMEGDAVLELDLAAYMAVRPDQNRLRQLRAGLDDCRRVNPRHVVMPAQASISIAA